MNIIEKLISNIEDVVEGHRLIQSKRKAFSYSLMEQGVCLEPENDKVVRLLQRGADRCSELLQDITREFSN